MIDLIKKALFTGIGFAAITKDKVEEVAQGFGEQGKMSKKEGEKLVDDILERSKESQEELAGKIRDYLDILRSRELIMAIISAELR